MYYRNRETQRRLKKTGDHSKFSPYYSKKKGRWVRSYFRKRRCRWKRIARKSVRQGYRTDYETYSKGNIEKKKRPIFFTDIIH